MGSIVEFPTNMGHQPKRKERQKKSKFNHNTINWPEMCLGYPLNCLWNNKRVPFKTNTFLSCFLHWFNCQQGSPSFRNKRIRAITKIRPDSNYFRFMVTANHRHIRASNPHGNIIVYLHIRGGWGRLTFRSTLVKHFEVPCLKMICSHSSNLCSYYSWL